MNGKLIIVVNLFFYITLLGQWKGVGANQTSDSSSATPSSTNPDPSASESTSPDGSSSDSSGTPAATNPDPSSSSETTNPDPTSSTAPDDTSATTDQDASKSTAPDDTSATTPDQTAPDATSSTDQDPTASESTDPSATSLTTAPDASESTDQSTSESATETDQTLTVSETDATVVSTDSAKGVTLDVNKTASTAKYECTNDRNFHKYVPKNGGVFGRVVQGSTVVWESDGSVYGTEVIFVSVTKYLTVLLDNNKFSFFKYYFAKWNDMTNKRYDVSKLKLYGENDQELSSYDYRVNLRLYSFRYEFNEGVKCLKVKYGDDVVWKDSDDSDFKSVKMFLLDLPSNNFFVKNHSDKVKRVCPKPDQDASESTAPDTSSTAPDDTSATTDQDQSATAPDQTTASSSPDQSATAPDSSTNPDTTSSSTPAATNPDATAPATSPDQATATATTGSDQDSGSPTAASSD